nr:MAG: hypothetical protein AM324_03430 [Candidatus Thorarchaeota archaeon SMTZ1-83]
MCGRIVEKNTSLLSEIIRQGTEEGLFNVRNCNDMAQMILQVGKDVNETVSRLLHREDKRPEHLVRAIGGKVSLYEDALSAYWARLRVGQGLSRK